MGRGMPVDSPLVWGEFWCPNFFQILDYRIFKGVEHCLKPFFPTNKKLMAKGEVLQPAPVFPFSFSLDFSISVQFWFLHF